MLKLELEGVDISKEREQCREALISGIMYRSTRLPGSLIERGFTEFLKMSAIDNKIENYLAYLLLLRVGREEFEVNQNISGIYIAVKPAAIAKIFKELA